jgi:hypothetical protein
MQEMRMRLQDSRLRSCWNSLPALFLWLALQVPSWAGPVVSLSPTSLDLGAIHVGETSQRTLTITNTGDAPLYINHVWFDGPYN